MFRGQNLRDFDSVSGSCSCDNSRSFKIANFAYRVHRGSSWGNENEKGTYSRLTNVVVSANSEVIAESNDSDSVTITRG